MDLDEDLDSPYPGIMSTAEMLNTFDTDTGLPMQHADSFFDSALPFESSNQLSSDNPTSKPKLDSADPSEMQPTREPLDSLNGQHPISTSPESSLQDCYSDSSGEHKRKNSSKSSQSGLSAIDSPFAHVSIAKDSRQMSVGVKRESALSERADTILGLASFDQNNCNGGHAFAFASPDSSPNQEPSSSHAPFSGARHIAIQYQDSPISSISLPLSHTLTREASPTAGFARPGPTVMPKRPDDPYPMDLQQAQFNSAAMGGMERSAWSFGGNTPNMMPYQATMSGQCLDEHESLLGGGTCVASQPARLMPSTLLVNHTPPKSRVETQIPIRLVLFPVPKGVTKIHLPSYTISKPKLQVKPPPPPSPDTLELHTMLVCTSAMQDPRRLQQATIRAQYLSSLKVNHPDHFTPLDDLDKDDPARPLNGGEVHICGGCISRERKRAARKKSKKPEEDEAWLKDEAKRIIVFNTNEIRELQPVKPSRDNSAYPLPEDAVEVEVPMRIACYCRHHSEKLGYQVIITLRDSQDRLISQAFTDSIMITDDHKTHPTPDDMATNHCLLDGQRPILGDQMQVSGGILVPQDPQVTCSPGLYRNAHSTTDLQNLSQTMGARMVSQPMVPYAVPQNSSQANPASLTPRNLSRQASPSAAAAAGPLPKKRKASGGFNRLPTHLTMTRLQTGQSDQEQQQQWAPVASAPSASASPYTPVFPQTNGVHAHPQVQQHVQPGQISMGPQVPATHDVGRSPHANRSRSLEHFTSGPPVYSAPASALPTRAPSPSLGIQMTNALASNFGHSSASASVPCQGFSPQHVPVINKIIPNEGPMAGGVEIICLGSNFHQGLEVMFGNSPATTTTFWGDGTLVCLLPPAVRAGPVPVTFKHQFQQQQQQQLQIGQFTSPPSPQSRTFFRYINENEQDLVRQALLIVSHKMRGDVTDAAEVARWIVGAANNSNGQWLGNPQANTHQRHSSRTHTYLEGSADCEATVLKCLELIDLDESPFRARFDMPRRNGQTILHLAASLGFHRLVAGLLARGANPDSRDNNGMSPLHMATLYGHANIVRRLRVSGADSTMRSLAGFTPADMATSQEALHAVETLGLARSQSTGTRAMLKLSELSNTRFHSPGPWLSDASATDSEDSTSEESHCDETNILASNDMEVSNTAQWASSRRNSATIQPALSGSGLEGNHGYMYAVAAMAAWVEQFTARRDQLAAQIQQFQQSVNFTLPNLPAMPPLPNLPPMPNLPDYQIYPMMRRFSSFVPHRNPGLHSPSSRDMDSKEHDSRWWELLTGRNSPPAYEEIYPAKAGDDLDTKTASAAIATVDATADQKCSAIYDNVAAASSSRQQMPVTSAEQQVELELAQRRNVKRLRSDSKLFCIWIPLLIFVMGAMLKDRVPQAWHASRSAVSAFSEWRHKSATVGAM